jgi:hypothetical protein
MTDKKQYPQKAKVMIKRFPQLVFDAEYNGTLDREGTQHSYKLDFSGEMSVYQRLFTSEIFSVDFLIFKSLF